LKNILERLPRFRKQIAFTIGLVCDRVMTNISIDYLTGKSGINTGDSYLFNFRDKSVSGYPGDVHIIADNGQSFVIPSIKRKQIKDYFTPARCRVCFDKMNVFSDITVGDPHCLIGFDKHAGASMFVVRTSTGRNLFKAALRDKVISCRPISWDELLKGQKIRQKKIQWRSYIEVMKQAGNTLPNYYEVVKRYAPIAKNLAKFKKSLLYSKNLDNFSSREDLFQLVEKSLRSSKLSNFYRIPIRFLKKMASAFLAKINFKVIL
jgi:coenzyme F420 hydrogenase subunit beta